MLSSFSLCSWSLWFVSESSLSGNTSASPSLAFRVGPFRMSGWDDPSAWTAQWVAMRDIIALTFPFFFADISVSLLTLVVTACGLALFGVSLFVSWKLCWVPWRDRGLFSGSKDNNQEPLNYTDTETNEQENSEDFLDPPTPCPDSSMKISHTSPDLPLSTQPGGQENCAHAIRVQRQVTEPTPSARSVMPLPLWMQGKDHPIFLSC